MSLAADTLAAPHPAAPIVPAAATKPSLAGATRAELAEALAAVGVRPSEIRMRTTQLWHWIYHHGVRDFSAMRNVSKHLRAALAERYSLDRPEIVDRADLHRRHAQMADPHAAGGRARSRRRDRVRLHPRERPRHALRLEPGRLHADLHLLPHRHAALVRNLIAREIVAQLIIARDRLGDFPGLAPPGDGLVPGEGVRAISNIVFMGMGEPLYNFDNVRDAIDIISDGDGLSLSKRRITVSTSGVVPEIQRLGEETGAMLAISLHAVPTTSATSWCRSTRNIRSPICWRRAAPIPAPPTRGASPSNM